MSQHILEDASKEQKFDVDKWLSDVANSDQQLANFYELCREQISMEKAFSELLLSNNEKSSMLKGSAFMDMPLSATTGARYGRKVFLGGLPVGITSDEILGNFLHFGLARIDWPHKAFHEYIPPAGYAFIIFDHHSSVNKVIDMCSYVDYKYNIGIRTMDGGKRIIEVKPWEMKNNELILTPNWEHFNRLSVFVGGLPRTITACELALLVQEAVGGVAYVGIEIDDNVEYPKGAARVVFNNQESYVRALAMKELTVLTGGNERVAEIKPYLQPKVKCESCDTRFATSFCPQIRCLKYFCDGCWKVKHSMPGLTGHKAMQKGHYFSASAKGHVSKDVRKNMSSSYSIWPFASNTNSVESILSSSMYNTLGASDKRLQYQASLDSKYPLTPDFSPYTAFSGGSDSIFNFKP